MTYPEQTRLAWRTPKHGVRTPLFSDITGLFGSGLLWTIEIRRDMRACIHAQRELCAYGSRAVLCVGHLLNRLHLQAPVLHLRPLLTAQLNSGDTTMQIATLAGCHYRTHGNVGERRIGYTFDHTSGGNSIYNHARHHGTTRNGAIGTPNLI